MAGIVGQCGTVSGRGKGDSAIRLVSNSAAMPPATFTVRRMMIWVGILAVLFVSHTPVVREVMRYDQLIMYAQFPK